MEILQTQRMILRPYQEGDLEDFYKIGKNPNIGPSAGWRPHENEEESLRILKRFIVEMEVWAIVDRDTSRVIGSIGLHSDRRRDNSDAKMLGFVIDEEYWGRGIATEAAKRIISHAFQDLNVDILTVCHYHFNDGSRRVIEKCGFHYEGTLRLASRMYDGKIHDDVCYSMTKNEFFNSIQLY